MYDVSCILLLLFVPIGRYCTTCGFKAISHIMFQFLYLSKAFLPCSVSVENKITLEQLILH